MAKEEARQAVMDLTSFLNGASKDDIEKFAEELTMREHRTLQQEAFKLFLFAIGMWSQKKEGYYDLRNEDTVKISKEIVEKVPEAFYERKDGTLIPVVRYI